VKRTLIIGATSAIAREIALLLKARGDTLYLLGRDATKLERLREELGDCCVGSLPGDFAQTHENEARYRVAERALGDVDAVFIAHGDLGDQLESERSFAHAEGVFATNFLSVISFLIPIANDFEARRAGDIVVISSVAGDRGRPRNYTYGAAKGGLSIYLQGLRSRLHSSGVAVTTVRLGPVDTPMTVHHEKNALFAQPGDVAKTIVADSERGEDVYVPRIWRPIMAGVRNLPERVFQRLSFLSRR
jgi:decaprenylphospho-beta-D-erythro-pentofuranosid-2-ulose 2-reductase